MHQSPAASSSPEPQRRLRRVFIEDRQRKTLEHVRDHLGYADDVDPNAHDRATFRLINQRKQLEGAEGFRKREEAHRVNQLDRAELDQVIHHALLDALVACPRPFPRRFFPWLKTTLAYRALDHVRQDLGERDSTLPHDDGIKDVLDEILGDPQHPGAAFFTAPASPAYSQWLRTLDVPQIFDLADEYATYNLRRDDELFEVLAAVGKVRDRARRAKLEAERQAAA